jgi:hypothetical protein
MELWSFETANFKVVCSAEEEDLPPEDSFCDQNDIDAVRNGAVDWFCASVKVYFRGEEIAADYLGACAYESARDFVGEHIKYAAYAREQRAKGICCGSYFSQMVRTAIEEARVHIAQVKSIYLRQ